MKKETKKVEKSKLLKKLEQKLKIIEKSQKYLEEEISQIKKQGKKLRKKISKEKIAISLVNRAKRLRKTK